MTHPTKAVIGLLLGDYLKLMEIKTDDKQTPAENPNQLYTENELAACLKKVELIDFHAIQSVGPLTFTAYNAGHVLGAAMFMIELGGRTVFYTGDYSMEDDRHLMKVSLLEVNILCIYNIVVPEDW